jgi:resuscitation-promoting factor RpfB
MLRVVVSAVLLVTSMTPVVAQGCDKNYGGACVPVASDVDCAGGSGNGPAYVRGPVYVLSGDPYDLDRDGDGVACEK